MKRAPINTIYFFSLLCLQRWTWSAQKSRASRSTKSSSRFPCTKKSLSFTYRRDPRNCFSRVWEPQSTDKQWIQYWKVSLETTAALLILPNCVMILNLCKVKVELTNCERFTTLIECWQYILSYVEEDSQGTAPTLLHACPLLAS